VVEVADDRELKALDGPSAWLMAPGNAGKLIPLSKK